MTRYPRTVACCACLAAAALSGCQRTAASAEAETPSVLHEGAAAPSTDPRQRTIRATGTIRAVREHTVLVPRIRGQGSRMTLTWLIPNSAMVNKGDVVAEFDRTAQIDRARKALAKYEDLQHQVEQRKAENRANTETRAQEMEQARADLAKATLQLRIASVLAEIERLKNQVKQKDAQARVASLKTSHRHHGEADGAALRLLELKMERQRTELERAKNNAAKLEVKAPFSGMVAHEYTWRSGSRGPPQVGDQMYRGRPLLRVFDPSEMEVHAEIGEPDGAVLTRGARALVTLDAYPGLDFEARLQSASPVAASALGSPIRKFHARFSLGRHDPHLLPDLSAAIVINPNGQGPAAGGAR